MVEIVKMESEFERGREAAKAGVSLLELYSLPSRQCLLSYFTAHFVDYKLATVLAIAIRHCSPLDCEKIVAEIRDLSPKTINALAGIATLAARPAMVIDNHNNRNDCGDLSA
jgi:hypothetical protein